MAYPVLKEQTLLDLTVSPSLVATLDLLAKTGASQLDWEWGADDGQGYAYVRLISRELESLTTDLRDPAEKERIMDAKRRITAEREELRLDEEMVRGRIEANPNQPSRPLRDIMAEHDL